MSNNNTEPHTHRQFAIPVRVLGISVGDAAPFFPEHVSARRERDDADGSVHDQGGRLNRRNDFQNDEREREREIRQHKHPACWVRQMSCMSVTAPCLFFQTSLVFASKRYLSGTRCLGGTWPCQSILQYVGRSPPSCAGGASGFTCTERTLQSKSTPLTVAAMNRSRASSRKECGTLFYSIVASRHHRFRALAVGRGRGGGGKLPLGRQHRLTAEELVIETSAVYCSPAEASGTVTDSTAGATAGATDAPPSSRPAATARTAAAIAAASPPLDNQAPRPLLTPPATLPPFRRAGGTGSKSGRWVPPLPPLALLRARFLVLLRPVVMMRLSLSLLLLRLPAWSSLTRSRLCSPAGVVCALPSPAASRRYCPSCRRLPPP